MKTIINYIRQKRKLAGYITIVILLAVSILIYQSCSADENFKEGDLEVMVYEAIK